uniref:Putative COBW domain-containing protein 7 n=1 Tax=Coturnix japonica TaxID=93934 RepID=A0A8C2T7W1_COTJA
PRLHEKKREQALSKLGLEGGVPSAGGLPGISLGSSGHPADGTALGSPARPCAQRGAGGAPPNGEGAARPRALPGTPAAPLSHRPPGLRGASRPASVPRGPAVREPEPAPLRRTEPPLFAPPLAPTGSLCEAAAPAVEPRRAGGTGHRYGEEPHPGADGADDALRGPAADGRRGGLRRPTGLLESQRNYLPSFVQSLLSSVDLRDRQGCTMVVGSDGRYLSKTAIEIVVQMAAANGHLTEEKPEGLVNEASRQVALADLVIVNKTDLVSREELNKVRTTVRSINGLVEILETQRSRVDLSNVLDLHAFDSLSGISLQKKLESMKTTDAHLDKDIVTVTLEVLGNIKEENLNLFIQNLLWEKNVKDRTGCTMDVIRLKHLTEEKPEGLVNEHLGMDIKTTFLIIVSDCTVRKIIQN